MKFRREVQRNLRYNQCQTHRGIAGGFSQDYCPMCMQETLERVMAGKQDFDDVLDPKHLIGILHRLLLETNINTQVIEHLRHEGVVKP
jgi:hypothetical protein